MSQGADGQVPHAFTKEAIDQRQLLLQQLCKLVWDVNALDLAPQKPSVPRPRAARSRKKIAPTIAPLIKAGIVGLGETLTSKRKGIEYTATVDADGSLILPTGEPFKTPE